MKMSGTQQQEHPGSVMARLLAEFMVSAAIQAATPHSEEPTSRVAQLETRSPEWLEVKEIPE